MFIYLKRLGNCDEMSFPCPMTSSEEKKKSPICQEGAAGERAFWRPGALRRKKNERWIKEKKQ